MKRRPLTQKSSQPSSIRAQQEELLWLAEHGDVPTLDLHGLSTLAAEHELAQFIHDQSYRRILVVCIIHGHGTGKIRQVVETWLKAHPELVSYARPALSQRGNGAIFAILQQ